MIPTNRTEGRYKGFDPRTLPTDSYERIYQSHDPKVDSIEHTTFDLRAPHNSHMSTVAYLERTFDFVMEELDDNSGHFISGQLSSRDAENLQVGSPGFALQNNIKNMTMDFGYTTVTEHPHEWVPFYTHLYPESLKNHIKYSGRSFHQERADSYDTHGRMQIELDEVIKRRVDPTKFGGVIPDAHNSVLDYYTPVPDEVPTLFSFGRRTDVAVLPMVNFGTVVDKYLYDDFNTVDGVPAAGYITDWRRLGVGASVPDFSVADGVGAHVLKAILDSLTHHSMTSLLTIYTDYTAGLTARAAIEAIEEAARTDAQKQQLEAADAIVHSKKPTVDKIKAVADFMSELFRKHEATQNYIKNGLVIDEANIMDGYMLLPKTMQVYLAHIVAYPQLHRPGLAGNYRHWTHDYATSVVATVQLPGGNTLAHLNEDCTQILKMASFTPALQQLTPPVIVEYYNNKAEDAAALAEVNVELAKDPVPPDTMKNLFCRELAVGRNAQTLQRIFEHGFGYNEDDDDRSDKQKVTSNAVLDNRNKVKFWIDYYDNYVIPLVRKRTLIEAKAVKDPATGNVVIPEDGDFKLAAVQAHLQLTFLEPLVVGVHKPGVHCNFGCWRDTGDIIPRVDRYKYHIDWMDRLGYRLLFYDSVIEDDFPPIRFTCKGVSNTKLHTIHYRGLMNPHADLYLHDMRLHVLQSFTLNDLDEHTFDFNLHYRSIPDPLYIAFFTKLHPPDKNTPMKRYSMIYHQGPGITKLLLHNNTRSNVFDYSRGDNKARLNMLVQDCYPEYSSSFEGFGSACLIPFAALPQPVHREHFADDIRGRISVQNTIKNFKSFDDLDEYAVDVDYKCDICALLIYKDKYLSLEENNARRVLDL